MTGENKRHHEEARLRHELERRAREAGTGGAEAQAADGGGTRPGRITFTMHSWGLREFEKGNTTVGGDA